MNISRCALLSSGVITLGMGSYLLNGNMKVNSALFTGDLSSYVKKMSADSASYAARAELNYRYRSGKKQHFVLNNKLRDLSTKPLRHMTLIR